MRTIDLRSDTVTLPSPAMRRAMAEAEVGDDVYGEDPSINLLEARAAELMGKEAGLFVASGTMSNLVALLTHCGRGDEAIVGSEAHVLHYEVAGAAGLGGIQLRTAPNDARGRLDAEDVRALIRGENVHHPRTALVCLENTHNRCFGAALTAADIDAVAAVAHEHGCAVHVDGARIFNASVALGVPAATLVRDVDSIGFCLSKGLGAPVGSVLCGSAEFIARARKTRKMVGGGMRQAGILAAAGLYALDHMIERLAEDHANARRLAAGLASVPGINIDPDAVETNIVVLEVLRPSVPEFLAELRAAGVLAGSPGPRRVRLVTHYGIEATDIDETLSRIARVQGAPVRA
ncbi:MAG TPA: low-specificity L-threonine aldolase [Dehalococcoidia bacterium]|jgi:threonine aldolase|nr:low-specificity L-threonine aldolase [Dehalococcoidia bacterium]